jgi:acyl transferase domain-containing protein
MELGSESVFAADQGLFTLLTTLGLQAQAMLGHSTGENAALVASGWPRLNEVQLGDYIRRMNALYRKLDASGTIPEGVLLSVGATSLHSVQAALEAIPGLVLAMDNCTNQFILFGPEAAIEQATGRLKADGAVCTRLALARGYHTPDMAPMGEAFRSLFEHIDFSASSVVLYSCVTAAPFPVDRDGILETASHQYMNRVRFRESIERLHADGVRVFVEVGPSAHLSAFVRDILKDRPHVVVSSNDRHRDGWAQLQHLFGRLFVHGVGMNVEALVPAAPAPARVKPYLTTSLPLIELEQGEAERMRSLLAVDEAATARAAPPARGAGVGGDRSRALAEHLELMQDFLAQQDRIMAQWLRRRGQHKG